MRVRCSNCGMKTVLNRNNGNLQIIKLWEKYQVYFCRKCREKIVLKELEKIGMKK